MVFITKTLQIIIFNNWKDRVLSGWNLIRFIRLGLAAMVLYESVKNSDLLFAVLGVIILLQAVLNVGCCGVGGCEVSPKTNNANENISFTEVK